MRHLADNLTCLWIVFSDRVLPNVNEPFVVHCHAVALRRIEGADDVPVLVDVDHGWRPDTAGGLRRSQLSRELELRQVVGTIQHPHVIVVIHSQACHAAHLPLVRKRFRPVWIELELRRAWLLREQQST